MEQNSPSPIPPYYSPEKKNPNTFYVIIALTGLCILLVMLLVASYFKSRELKNQLEQIVIPIQNSSNNIDVQQSPPPVVAVDSAPVNIPQEIIVESAPAISLEKMNVFYIGVDNPVSIAVAGTSPGDINVTITGGTMTRNGKPGSYIVRVTGGTKATIAISTNKNGILKSVGSYSFRIKRIPDPVAYVGNLKADGMMTKPELLNQSGVLCRMENFDFDVKYDVVSFVMSMNVNGVEIEKKSTGPALNSEMKTLLQSVKPGSKVLFEQITVHGPDGTLRKIPGVVIKVK